jgi:hypothetical protein
LKRGPTRSVHCRVAIVVESRLVDAHVKPKAAGPDMDFDLPSELAMLKDTVARIVDEELIPN